MTPLRPAPAPRSTLASLGVALTLALAAPDAIAQCPAPSQFGGIPTCDGVRLGWTGTRIGTSWRILRAAPHQAGVVIGSVTGNTFTDTTAQPGVIYNYAVQQFGGVCGVNSPFAGPIALQSGTPGPPSGVTADDGVSCEAVHVTWNAEPPSTSYDVARGTSTNVNDAVLVGTTSQTSFDDTTAIGGVQYWYWVRGRASCVGDFQAAGEPGLIKSRFLPDLIVDPNGLDAPGLAFAEGGHLVFRFGSAVANVGNARLHLYPFNGYYDGTKDFFQQDIGCNGGIQDRYLGRFGVTIPGGQTTFPHFIRAKFREHLPGGPGRTLSMVDVPAACVQDLEVFDAATPGFSPTPQYTTCSPAASGLSIGWEVFYPRGSLGQDLSVDCLSDGVYWLELTVDPDNMIEERDETNNAYSIPVTFSGLPTPTCTNPPIVARLESPDTLVVAVGAATDSIIARAWAPGITDIPGDPEPGAVSRFVEVGFAPVTLDPPAVDAWTWFPAQWRRQDGEEDVFGATLVFPAPGDYDYAFRFFDVDDVPVMADRDGSSNGFSSAQAGRAHVRATTGVGDDPGGPPAALAFSALSTAPHGGARFALTLPEATRARITMYDVLGRRVSSIDTGTLAAGPHVVDWDGRSDAGAPVRSGVYLARLETSAGERLATKFLSVAR